MDKLPESSVVLIQILDEEVSHPRIAPGYDKEKSLYMAGRRSVVDELIALAGNAYVKPEPALALVKASRHMGPVEFREAINKSATKG